MAAQAEHARLMRQHRTGIARLLRMLWKIALLQWPLVMSEAYSNPVCCPVPSLVQKILAFVVGVDKQPRVMTEPEVSSLLQDPLAALMLKQVPPGERPQSFDATVNFIVRARWLLSSLKLSQPVCVEIAVAAFANSAWSKGLLGMRFRWPHFWQRI
jgi:hypothetical protein